jgi:tRNA(Arg) A34 adenosine deaminase TadA
VRTWAGHSPDARLPWPGSCGYWPFDYWVQLQTVRRIVDERSSSAAAIVKQPREAKTTNRLLGRQREDLVDARDEGYLRTAIRLAVEARHAGGQPYGALLVAADGTVLAKDRNTVVTERDITAHPELKLARWAARELSVTAARTTTMYTSCQPCAMCANVIARAKLARVVYALAGDQLHDLKPPGSVDPDATRVAYDGPALFGGARVPIDGYYG